MLAPLLLAVLVALPLAAPASPQEDVPDLGEVEVTGEQPGPALWKVTLPASQGAGQEPHVLWIMGTLRPLPRKMEWRSLAAERALDAAGRDGGLFIPYQPDIDVKAGPFALIGLFFSARTALKDPDGRPLRESLPAPLYARFQALQKKYAPRDSSLEKRRPAIAAIELYSAALEQAKLSGRLDVESLLARQARKRSVKVRPVKLPLEEPKALLAELSALPRDTELACVAATLDRLETDLGPMRARADAWAIGDMEALRRLPFPQQETTYSDAVATSPRFKTLMQQARAGWLEAVSTALRQHRVSVTTAPLQSLLRTGGIADQLRARGFVVEVPESN